MKPEEKESNREQHCILPHNIIKTVSQVEIMLCIALSTGCLFPPSPHSVCHSLTASSPVTSPHLFSSYTPSGPLFFPLQLTLFSPLISRSRFMQMSNTASEMLQVRASATPLSLLQRENRVFLHDDNSCLARKCIDTFCFSDKDGLVICHHLSN